MRSDRLLSLLLLLQARPRTTAPELARRLEVSVRTVYRDVTALSAAGVPVFTEQGAGGGIRLLEGYRTDVTGLTADESRALVALAGRALPEGHGMGSALASALRKLVVAVPEPHRAGAERARDRVLVDHHGWYRAEVPAPLLPAVQEAVLEGRRLRMVYRHADVRRPDSGYLVDPWGLVAKAGTWYLVAAHRGRPRTFRVDRIAAARDAGAPARRPDDLDLAALWRRLRGDFERCDDPLVVALRVRRERAGSLLGTTRRQRVGPGGDPVAEEEPVGPDPDPGWERHLLRFRVPPAAAAALLGFGGDVEVLDPPELRQRLAAEAARVVALYRGGDGDRPGTVYVTRAVPPDGGPEDDRGVRFRTG